MQKSFFTSQTHAVLLLVATLSVASYSLSVEAQQNGQLVQPIYRVAHEEPVEQAPQLVARVAHKQCQSSNT